MREKVVALSDEEFQTQKDSVLTVISEKPKNMAESFNEMHTEVMQFHY